MPDDVHISLPVVQFVDREIDAAMSRCFERFEAILEADRLQRTEMLRRLDVLNHAHEDMVRDRTQFLRIDTHDRFYAEFSKWKDETNNAISNIQGRAQATVMVIGIGFTVIQLILFAVNWFLWRH
jgi:hypothetical protein